jgi:diketogulonate reductase-like aldo/keto reductase
VVDALTTAHEHVPRDDGQQIRENIYVFDFELIPDEVASIDALDTGVRAGPDPETLNMTTYPKTVEN